MTNLGPQFDQERLDRALAIPVEERRTRGFRARKDAAQRDATNWALCVHHGSGSSNSVARGGVLDQEVSRVLVSREEVPDPLEAEAVAYQIGHARGTFPTRVSHE
jgi:hypothetical protein